MHKILIAILLLFSQTHLSAQTRTIINFNEGWQYFENATEDIAHIAENTTPHNINLPHTWNQWDATDITPGYRRSASWYVKDMEMEIDLAKRYVLYFEGANISTEVYVNGQLAGTHIGGYVGFEFDISKHLIKGQKNTISVRVDNGYDPNIIPSQKADFFIYGGITRDVWLKILPEINLINVEVTTVNVSEMSATTSLKVKVNNPSLLGENFTVKSEISEQATGKVVSEKTAQASEIKEGNSILFPKINNPKLWSPDNPSLYTVTTQLIKNRKVIDEKTETIGYRWYHFEDYGAFFLNGKKLLLRGTHRHEEHAGYGAAMPNELHRKDIQLIKEMGANFLRLGHYPQDPEIYKACNELGIIVWDELPWCRGGMGGEEWKKNTERLFREQINQNYNHPSIFFWSVGNEIYWLPDFENGDDEKRLNEFVEKLHNIAHELDDTRMTAIRKYYTGANLVDVFSPSIWSGWYAGVYTNYENTLTKNQELYPRFLHMEYGGSSHVGRHTENPITGDGSMKEDDWAEVSNQVDIKNIAKNGDWTENYIVDLFDWYLGVTEAQENFAGNAQWAFKDFGTPLRPENAIPYLNQKGLVDRAGNPKDALYVFKSYWAKDPFTYIESHTWTERRGPKDKKRNISVFSNCEKVELIQNGKSLGIKNRVVGEFPACGLNWDIQFSEGKNQLIAQGFQGEKTITADTLIVNYEYSQAEKADHIKLNSKFLPNGNYLVEATMLDKNGRRVLDYERPVYFSRDGAGELMKNYGTPTRSQVIQMANGYAAIELVPSEKGKAIIEVRNQDFKGSYLAIDFAEDN